MATIEENLQKIADDVSAIKTNLGLQSNASLDDVVEISEDAVYPTGTISITENGTVDVTNYASADVNVSGGGADLTEYFNMTPTLEEMTNTDIWVRDYFVKKRPDLIIPDSITSIANLCQDVKNYVPKIICNDNVTNMANLYFSCTAKTIDISGLNTSNVTRIGTMFYDCQNLEEMDLSSLDLSKISSSTSYRQQVFQKCYNLTKVVVPSTCNRSLRRWFNDCYSLKTLVILNEDDVVDYDSTFSNCYHMDGTVNATYNPQGLQDGRIYVPDNLVDNYKAVSGWSTYANQILPLSELTTE